ncbi:TIGR04076 family protein [Candidatus Calescamantes bacterium]|nr:TIGR04076 family protein [Candidatus Calescamantes bacterium]
MPKVKITVLKKTFHKDLADKYSFHNWRPCDKLKEGQEFLVENSEMPSGFCSWAWADIHKYVISLSRGANFMSFKPGVIIACCTDGIRPVIFKIERLEEMKLFKEEELKCTKKPGNGS